VQARVVALQPFSSHRCFAASAGDGNPLEIEPARFQFESGSMLDEVQDAIAQAMLLSAAAKEFLVHRTPTLLEVTTGSGGSNFALEIDLVHQTVELRAQSADGSQSSHRYTCVCCVASGVADVDAHDARAAAPSPIVHARDSTPTMQIRPCGARLGGGQRCRRSQQLGDGGCLTRVGSGGHASGSALSRAPPDDAPHGPPRLVCTDHHARQLTRQWGRWAGSGSGRRGCGWRWRPHAHAAQPAHGVGGGTSDIARAQAN